MKAAAQASGSASLVDLASRINSMAEAIVGFKSHGMYREAAYTAGFAVAAIDEFLSREPSIDSLLAARMALQEIRALPSVSPPRKLDRMAPSQSAQVREEPGPYQERFPVGTSIRIADAIALREFMQHWKLHHPLQAEQLKFAGLASKVSRVGYYHGGDPLYSLADTGEYVWHEACLRADHKPG